MKKLIFSLFVCSFLLAVGCQKETINDPSQSGQSESGQYTAPLTSDEITSRSNCPWAVIPAGSVDMLADAIAGICDDGVIYFKAGMHTEHVGLTITKPVKLIGEAGAVLKIKADLSPTDTTTGLATLHPGLCFLNAPGSLVQDLEIQPLDTDGGTALLFENSTGAAVMRCRISSFQMGIIVEKSDRMTIMFNKVATTSLWQTGQVANAFGITVMNGHSAYVSDNEVTNSLFGIWACDRWGTCERNFAHGNYIGIILCKVPPAIQLPSGEITGSIYPATRWKTRNNKSNDNFNIGYLAIDGANNNWIENNEASGNGAYDMELTTDTYRFGFLTPMAHDNTIIVGAYPNITIKDCGDNNSIDGGILVNNAIDPCN